MKQIILYSKMDPIPEGLINAVHTGHTDMRLVSSWKRQSAKVHHEKGVRHDLYRTKSGDFEFTKRNPKRHKNTCHWSDNGVYSEACNREEHLLDHVIAYSPDGYLTKLEVVTTLKKLLTNEMFGLDKYLKGGTEVIIKEVTGPSARAAQFRSYGICQQP